MHYVCVFVYALYWAEVTQFLMRHRDLPCSLRNTTCSYQTGSRAGSSCPFQIKMLFQASLTQHLLQSPGENDRYKDPA